MTSTETTGYDPKMLARIRGLLAKAQSTNSPAEAEALSDKAQELLAKYNIDARVVDASQGEDRSAVAKRMVIVGTGGYNKQQTELIASIATALGVYPVRTWSPEAQRKLKDRFETNPRRDAMWLYGTEASNELVELLYTSLVLQSSSALKVLTIADVPAHIRRRARSQAAAVRSFRSAWYHGWVEGVGARLREAHGRAVKQAAKEGKVGAELVLASDMDRFKAFAKEEFGTRLSPAKRVYRDIVSAAAGRTASDSADIGLTRVGGKRAAIGG